MANTDILVQVQCCFTSTETIRTIRDGEPRTATSTFTQLLSSESERARMSSFVRQTREVIFACQGDAVVACDVHAVALERGKPLMSLLPFFVHSFRLYVFKSLVVCNKPQSTIIATTAITISLSVVLLRARARVCVCMCVCVCVCEREREGERERERVCVCFVLVLPEYVSVCSVSLLPE